MDTKVFVKELSKRGVSYVSGVPDSLLKQLINEIEQSWQRGLHDIASNEGCAIASAIGHYLGSGKIPLVYMQNSGLGNAYSPLVSLASPEVYGIPMILVIGWRSEAIDETHYLQDEPQHRLQGQITTSTLDAMNIPWVVIDANSDPLTVVNDAIKSAETTHGPTALLVRKETFSKVSEHLRIDSTAPTRSEILNCVLNTISHETTIVSTTGYTSRQLLQVRIALNQSSENDFLVIGGMGHAISIATGLAITNTQKRVLCIDGDGSLSMHTGSLFRSAKQQNLTHLVINNQSHDSVGGQRTTSADSKLHKIAESFGYKYSFLAEDLQSLNNVLEYVNNFENSVFIEVSSRGRNEPGLIRPKLPAVQMRDLFMHHQLLRSDNNGSI